MFNLTVSEAHTFYVGQNGWLVHNCEDILWTNHGFKHFPQKNMDWVDIVKSTKKGPAKYFSGTNVEELERMVWQSGTLVANGRPWKVMEFEDAIGASGGSTSRWMRVEFSGSTIHGHPITKAEYDKLLKPKK